MKKKKISIFTWSLIKPALGQAVVKLNPLYLVKNPVLFCVEIVAFLTTLIIFRNAFAMQLAIWLWFTVLFANFAEALAEGKGKAQAAMLRKTKQELKAKVLAKGSDKYQIISADDLKPGMIVLIETDDLIPGDGDVIEGMALIDESAITGESAPVVRESGGDRSAVTAGTQVISDQIKVKITSSPGDNFLDRMINLVESAKRQKPPNEIALSILLFGFTLIFIMSVATIEAFALYAGKAIPITLLFALFVTLIPTTIAGLLSAIGISGMDRLMQANVLAMSGRAVESAGDIDTLLLDKTGTITIGNRMATEFITMPNVELKTLAHMALLSSLKDETPEGRSIVTLAKKPRYELKKSDFVLAKAEYIPFSAETRMSGVDLSDMQVRKGAAGSIIDWVEKQGGAIPKHLDDAVDNIAKQGGTPLVVCKNTEILGVIHLKDIVKQGIRERFMQLRKMGIRTVMITGDNPLTAASIAAESGVDDFLAQATPESKLKLIRQEQEQGKMVAMCGDGTNDAPALAQANVGVAMATGTSAAREAANMVDLDSDPSKVIEVVKTGKQLLMTRGALTTFSISNDIAKYFAIIPALFATQYPALQALNIMHLHSPQSAVISAVIFNALIIIMLIPLALKGIRFRVMTAANMLRRNLLIYGLGGIIAPFIGIKLLDIIVNILGGG